MNERRNDLEIMNWIPQIALQIQTRIDLLFTMSKIPQARPLGARLRSDVFADVILWSLTVSPSSLFELRRARFAFGSARLRHAKPKAKRGGARRDRTDDLMLAKHALSQLSYGPIS